MTRSLSIFLSAILFLAASCSDQHSSENNSTCKLVSPFVGIWKVTDSDNPTLFEDFWELKENGEFNELEYGREELNIDTLIADENGTWRYQSDSLTLIVTNEMSNDKRVNYPSPQRLSFGVQFKSDTILLSIPGNKRTKTLKLTPYHR